MTRRPVLIPELELAEGERLLLAVEDRGPHGGVWLLMRLAVGQHAQRATINAVTVEEEPVRFHIALRELRANVAAAAVASR